MALVKKNSIQCTIDKVYVWAIQFHEFQSTFLHIKAHLLHFLRKDLKYHHKGKNEIKTYLNFENLTTTYISKYVYTGRNISDRV